MQKSVLFIILAASLIQPVLVGAETTQQGLAESVFYVAWYDVGKSALVGLNGIKKVTSGFRGFKEINTVTYDSDKVTIDQLTETLKKAGTYLGIAE